MNTSIKNCHLDKAETATIKFCYANQLSNNKTEYSRLHTEKHFFRD